ncbi:unnamed protein product, partial [Durusdinium trenchii]
VQKGRHGAPKKDGDLGDDLDFLVPGFGRRKHATTAPKTPLPSPSFSPATAFSGHFQLVDAECWAYCQRGYVGDPQRYFCRVNAATGLPEVVAENVEATCAVDANATNTTAGGARRLQSTPCDATSAQ